MRARVGGWAELLEQAGSHAAARRWDRRCASYRQLVDAGEPVVDPRWLRLPAGSDYHPDRPCVWIRARRYRPDLPWNQHPAAWVVLEAAATHGYDLTGPGGEAFPFEPLFQPISNGDGAGYTRARALDHALLELVQRDGNSAGYRAADRGIGVELDQVRHPGSRELLDRLDDAGIQLQVKLADTNLGMTNLYVVGHERDPAAAPHPIVLTGCGEAAHPDREAALHKALLEFCASRVRKLFTHGPLDLIRPVLPDGYLERFAQNPATVEESRRFDDVHRLAHLDAAQVMELIDPSVLHVDEQVRFSELPSVEFGSMDQVEPRLAEVARRFTEEGLEIYWIDCGTGASDCHAVKAIVGPMEVEMMTCHHIGRRNLDRLRDRDRDRGRGWVGYGPPPTGAQRVQLADGGGAWMDTAAVDRAVGPLYGLYREPEIHAVAIRDAAGEVAAV